MSLSLALPDEPSVLLAAGFASSFFASSAAWAAAALLALEGRPRRGLGAWLLVTLLASAPVLPVSLLAVDPAVLAVLPVPVRPVELEAGLLAAVLLLVPVVLLAVLLRVVAGFVALEPEAAEEVLLFEVPDSGGLLSEADVLAVVLLAVVLAA